MSDQPSNLVTNAELVARRDSLVRRLDDGYARIDQALLSGEDVVAWEEFWIDLLNQYERLSDELDRAA